MTQQKAASLTSGLFARKGKASPASLLISELEASGMAAPEAPANGSGNGANGAAAFNGRRRPRAAPDRSEEHTSELQSLMRISYAVFCLKKKTNKTRTHR